MAYTISWYRPQQIIFLSFEDQLSDNELKEINSKVTDMLNAHQKNLHIVIDASKLQTSYHTAKLLKETQKYMDHSLLDSMFVIAENKLNRLITLMAFSMGRAKFIQFDDLQKAENYLKLRGFAGAS